MIGVIAVAAYFISITRAPSAPSTDIQNTVPGATQTAEGYIYRISQEESSVSFEINEILADEPFTAVGTTNQVAADMVLKTDSESGHQYFDFGTIRVDARTFKTDSTSRDGMIDRAILKAENPANEFIMYQVASVGLPDAPATDVATPFSVTGDLTISGVTKPVTFTGTFTGNSMKIQGNVSAQIKRSDFGLTIPNVPFVASVDDSFVIKATIVAYHVTS